LEDTDRGLRQEVWEKTTGRRLEDREPIESTFDDLLSLRQQIAHNADLPDYRAYMWKAFGRFDYQPEDCHAFARSIEQVIVPKMADLDRQRRDAP
ncbi:MAG: M3 family oligoendopeptidase, partial [Verrucomicrobiota bacterium]